MLPWGSIANLTDGEHNLPVVTGPCKYQATWCLPVWGVGKLDSDPTSLRATGQDFRKQRGLDAYQV